MEEAALLTAAAHYRAKLFIWAKQTDEGLLLFGSFCICLPTTGSRQ